MSAAPAYPFAPKSTLGLRAGDFWDIPLADGTFGAGRVLWTPTTAGVSAGAHPGGQRIFAGGVLDWRSKSPPTGEAIAGRPLVDWGLLHVVGLRDAGCQIRGWRDLAEDGLVGIRFADSAWGGHLYEDGRLLETSSGRNDNVKIQTTWGRSVMINLANRHFGLDTSAP